jgi:hypothetical protein
MLAVAQLAGVADGSDYGQRRDPDFGNRNDVPTQACERKSTGSPSDARYLVAREKGTGGKRQHAAKLRL